MSVSIKSVAKVPSTSIRTHLLAGTFCFLVGIVVGFTFAYFVFSPPLPRTDKHDFVETGKEIEPKGEESKSIIIGVVVLMVVVGSVITVILFKRPHPIHPANTEPFTPLLNDLHMPSSQFEWRNMDDDDAAKEFMEKYTI